MNKYHASSEGILLRRRNQNAPQRRLGIDDLKVPHRFLDKQSVPAPDTLPEPRAASIRASELDDSFRQIDEQSSNKARKRRFLKKSLIKRLILGVVLLIIIVGLFFGIKAFLASSKVFGGNLFDLFSTGKPLKTDEFGRSNIVLFGTSEDSPAHQETGGGPNLSDSILLLSIDQKTNATALTSVPRDLWVKYDRACLSGFEGKINVVYQCGSDDGENERAGSGLLMEKIGETYGLQMHYYIHVNYAALRETVDAVGGVTVNIESDDPRGILDRNFDWQCNYECYLVRYPNGPAKLDGERALALARARNSAGGYGLSGSNFDREANQQKILLALRDRLASAGILTNPVAVSGLIDTLGNNVRTNFEAGEIKTLLDVASKVQSSAIARLDFQAKDDPLFTTGNVDGQSIVQPTAGLYDFSEIKNYVRKALSSDPFVKEAATVDVLNGSGVAGMAQTKADELAALGFSITTIDNAPPSDAYGVYSVYAVGNAAKTKPATLKKLESLLGVKAIGTGLPEGITTTSQFVVVVGAGGGG